MFAKTSLMALALMALNGCASPPVQLLQASPQCLGGQDRVVRWLGDAEQLASAWRLASPRLPATPVPEVDFVRRAVVLVADAEQSTAGHGLNLADPALPIRSGVATLSVASGTPVGVAAQVVTRPCLFVAVPLGDYLSLEVRDQMGGVWGRVTRPEPVKPD